jgi:hypothetical protein
LQPGTRSRNGLDGESEQFRAAIFPVVAIHAGDDGVLQPHQRDGFGHAARLIVIDRQRRALLHRAEAAPPRADVAQDHERRGAMIPALADVRAGRALADRVQFQIRDQAFQLPVILAHQPTGSRARAARSTERVQAEIIILIKGFDDTFSQTVHSRYSYRYDEFVWNAKFQSAFVVDGSGDLLLELNRLGDHSLTSNVPVTRISRDDDPARTSKTA